MPGLSKANIKKTYYYLKKNGISATLYEVKGRLKKKDEYVKRTPSAKMLSRDEVADNKYPLISVLVPTYNTPADMLRMLLDSIEKQTYPKWELVIADGSTDDLVESLVKSECGEKNFAGTINYRRLSENKGITGNTNQALAFATGDYCCLLDHDDFLETDALEIIAKTIVDRTEETGERPVYLYSDEDKCDAEGKNFFDPNYKPDFNLDYLISNNYICHLTTVRTDVLKGLGFRKEFEGAQDHDLVLRAVYEAGATPVHIPVVLYHWRCFAGSSSENPANKLYAYEAGKNAAAAAVKAFGWDAEISDSNHVGFYLINYKTDIFETRKEVGAVGGIVVRGKSSGQILAGPSWDGNQLFRGLPGKYGGPVNRRCISQEADGLDIRNIRIRTELYDVFKDVVGTTYSENENGFFDYNLLGNDCEYDEISKKLSDAIRASGYKLIYMPEMETVWKK